MRYSRRFTDFRRSQLYRELKRSKGHKAVSVYQNLVDTVCEKYKAGQGNSFALVMPEEDWLREVDLHHNAKDTFQLVLDIARSNGAVVYTLLEGKLSINIPNIVEIADEYAKRKERDSGESSAQKEKKKEKSDFSSFAEETKDVSHFIEKVRTILSQNVREAFSELPSLIETFFERHGDRAGLINTIVDQITIQFNGTEKQRRKAINS
ncbi:MAG: hypothetical protein K2Q26_03620 [Bdellovibrionales bacterium]|nr:hypothetical protein [Bdellovibrionales bacterium]